MSPNRVEYHEGAASDIRSAVSWYRKQSESRPGFHSRAQSSYSSNRGISGSLAKRKRRHPAIPALALSVHGYLFKQRSLITVWAVAHGSRRPEYWMSRI
jgi:hypothetical protein